MAALSLVLKFIVLSGKSKRKSHPEAKPGHNTLGRISVEDNQGLIMTHLITQYRRPCNIGKDFRFSVKK